MGLIEKAKLKSKEIHKKALKLIKLRYIGHWFLHMRCGRTRSRSWSCCLHWAAANWSFNRGKTRIPRMWPTILRQRREFGCMWVIFSFAPPANQQHLTSPVSIAIAFVDRTVSLACIACHEIASLWHNAGWLVGNGKYQFKFHGILHSNIYGTFILLYWWCLYL